MNCPNCNEDINDSAKFCKFCGVNILQKTPNITKANTAKNEFLNQNSIVNKNEIIVLEDPIVIVSDSVKAETGLIIVGYLMSIFFGIIGLIVALIIRYKRKITRDTTNNVSCYYYDEISRSHSLIMILIVFAQIILMVILVLSQ